MLELQAGTIAVGDQAPSDRLLFPQMKEEVIDQELFTRILTEASKLTRMVKLPENGFGLFDARAGPESWEGGSERLVQVHACDPASCLISITAT